MTALMLALTSGTPTAWIVESQPRGTYTFRDHVLSERHFENQPFTEPFIGFYDWLRNPSRGIVGLRFILAQHADSVAELLPNEPYVHRHSPHSFSIFFDRTDLPIDEEASADQDFGETRVFCTDTLLLLAVDTGGVEQSEFAGLRLTDAT